MKITALVYTLSFGKTPKKPGPKGPWKKVSCKYCSGSYEKTRGIGIHTARVHRTV